MINTNEILERILLNMKYDSKKTLYENKSIIINEETEYCKKLKVDVKSKLTDPKQGTKRAKDGSDKYGTWGDGKAFCCNVEGQEDGTFNENCRKKGSGTANPADLDQNTIPDLKNFIKTIDYDGKPLYIYGQVQQTFGEWIGGLEEKINSNPVAFRKEQMIGSRVKKPYYATEQQWKAYNNNKLDPKSDLYQSIQKDVNAYRKETRGFTGEWEYTDDWIGYFAKLCRADLRKNMEPIKPQRTMKNTNPDSSEKRVENPNYNSEKAYYDQKIRDLRYGDNYGGYNKGYLEPLDVPICVKDSLKNLKTKIKPSSPNVFFAYNKEKKEFDKFVLSFNCSDDFTITDSDYNFETNKWEPKEKKYFYQTPCSKSVKIRGYYSRNANKWFKTIKKSQKKEYDRVLANIKNSENKLTQSFLNNQTINDVESENKIKQLPSFSDKNVDKDKKSGGITLIFAGG